MQVFLSYSHKDSELAKQIAEGLVEFGLDIWNSEAEIFPGDNWAEKVSEALKDSDAMVVLLTPESLESITVQREIEYALGNRSYSNRLIPVLIGSEEKLSEKNIPWILRRLKIIRLSKPEQTEEGINQITEALKLAA